MMQRDGCARPYKPGQDRWPDATLAPSYSFIAERGDLHPILMASCAHRPCSHRISLLTGTKLVPLHMTLQVEAEFVNWKEGY
eukprot:1157087-Pelagomonas_calceolata.AAC.6